MSLSDILDTFGFTLENTPQLIQIMLLMIIINNVGDLSYYLDVIRRRQRGLIELLVRDDAKIPIPGDDVTALFENGYRPSLMEKIRSLF